MKTNGRDLKRKSVKKKSAEKALEDFFKEYVNSGRMDEDLASISPSQRVQAITRFLPYCFPKAKEEPTPQDSTTGSEALALFFSRLQGK